MTRIDILLAVCDGEKFLSEQLNSILNQTHKNIRIIISDDASKDRSRQILEDFASRHPKKIELLFNKTRQGAKTNFSRLMEASTAPYVMFCDQDDLWRENKIEKTLHCMLNMELVEGAQPLLVHSDLHVVDEQLKMIHPSFWAYTKINPLRTHSLNQLLNQNVVTGCSMMANRLLIEVAKPIPEESFMHDWWLALIAAAFGKIGVVNEPLIYYRQHRKNALGAQKFGSIKNLVHNFRKLMRGDVRRQHQARVFYHRFQELMNNDQRNTLKAFMNLPQQSWHQKRYTIYKHRFYKQGLLRNVADFILG